MGTRIIDLSADDDLRVEATAELLLRGFGGLSPAWPTIELARAEVDEALEPGKINRVMVADDGDLVGWVGAQPIYDGHVWEVHPLVVVEHRRRCGHGRALMLDVEALVARRGAETLWLGTDDETGSTSLSGIDLYADPLGEMARVRNLAGHPFEFYQRVGFTIVGVLPDANGPGKPDIFMAKRVKRVTPRSAGTRRKP